MKILWKIALVCSCMTIALTLDITPLPSPQLQLVKEAHAVLGVRRRSFRRGVVVGATAASAANASAQSQAAAAPPPAPAPAPAPPPPAPAATGKPLPQGTVVSALPAGCTSTPVDGVDYFYCGGNFYRAAFQGSQVVYVTTKP